MPEYDEEQMELAGDIAHELNDARRERLKDSQYGYHIPISPEEILEAMGDSMYLVWVPEEHR